MDFTIKSYQQLLDVLIDSDYSFQTFKEFLENPGKRIIILRHDVEAKNDNALKFAEIQFKRGVKGTYYFRFLENHFDANDHENQ